MSLFQFLASDELLKEVQNPNVEFISINDAIERNIEIADFIVNDENIDKDIKNMMVCDSEECLDEIEINNEMYYPSEYVGRYSIKKHFAQLQWRYTEERALELIEYLKEQLKTSTEVEIWSIWSDEDKFASVRSINVETLTTEDLKFLDVSNGYPGPRYLIVKG